MRQVIVGVALVLLTISAGLAEDWEVFLNSNNITTIWLDGRRVLWGSAGAVVAYDVDTETFHKTVKSVGGLRSNTVTAVAADDDGRVWIGTAKNGLCVEDDGSWQFHDTRNFHLLSNDVLDISASGNMVAVGTSKGLSLFREGQFVRFFNGNDWSHTGCDSVLAVTLTAGQAMVGTSCGMFAYQLEGQTWSEVIAARSTNRIAYDGDGVFWILASDSIYTYDGTSLALVTKLGILPDLLRDIGANGSLAVVATNNGPSRYDSALKRWVRIKTGLPTELLDSRRVRVGEDGNVWMGTDDGLGLYQGSSWTITKSPGPASNYVQDICVERGGRVWFGTGYRFRGGAVGSDVGILRYDPDDGEWDQLKSPAIPSNRAYACETDPSDGSIWVGFWENAGALMRFDPATSNWTSYADSLKSRIVGALYFDQDSNLVFPEYVWGLGIRSKSGKFYHYSADDDDPCFKSRCITAVGPGPGGTYMLGNYFVSTEDPCIAEVVNLGVGEDLADKTDDLCQVWTSSAGWPQGIATYTFAVDPYGVIWLGSGGGLGAYDPWCGKWHATNVQVGSVWEVEVDSYGRLWLACDEGLFVLEGHGVEWDDFGVIQAFDSDNSILEGVPVKAIEFDADGAVWIGTGGGGIYRYAPGASVPPASTWINVYPNPYLAFEDACGKGIRFSGHQPGSVISIYTMSGQLVREIATDEAWDATNAAGEEVVSGLYLFLGKAEDGKDFKGRVVIVR
jgi:ligand-binding sensor domain-containing protein